MKLPSRTLEISLVLLAACLLLFGLLGRDLAVGHTNGRSVAAGTGSASTSHFTPNLNGAARTAMLDFEKTTGPINPKDLSALSQSTEGIDFLLSLDNLPRLDSHIAYTLSRQLIASAITEKKKPQKLLASLFLTPRHILAMMARDRDVADYVTSASASDNSNAGDSYNDVIKLVPVMRPLRTLFESVFKGAFDGLTEHSVGRKATATDPNAGRYTGGVTLPDEVYRPDPADFKYTHTYALDIFFQNVTTGPGSLETGAMLRSMADGIVVAASNTWKGGEGLDAYKGGGISPRAGNGVIYYSPETRKYYSYFHMHDIIVKAGEAVKRGQALGHGGNTGASAHIPGHGGHVHVEIYDAVNGRFLTNREIMAIIFN
jgi:murein DD-endopeptidase MepM/ murein hydrolase activator NlpD